MTLAEQLRALIAADGRPLSTIATEAEVSYATIHEFMNGRKGSPPADIRLAVAQKLIDHFGVKMSAPKRRKAKSA